MMHRFLADLLALTHLAFILFVLFGGLLAIRWRRALWVHLPAALWGAAVELFGWYCPLTPWENALRRAGGSAGYSGGFVENYLLSLIYPAGLTREVQMLLGGLVVAINGVVYWFVLRRWRHRNRQVG